MASLTVSFPDFEISDYPAQESFGVDLLASSVSTLMSSLHFSSRTARSVQQYRFQPEWARQLEEFILQARAAMLALKDRDRVMCLDQIGLWNSPSVLRSYAPTGW